MHDPDTLKSSLSSNHTISTNSTLDQQRPLIVNQVTEEQTIDHIPSILNTTAKHLRMWGKKRKEYSMGAADDKNKPADTSFHDARCCCGCMKLNVAAYLIALIEFVFILYNLFFAILGYDKAGDDHAFVFVLGVFCMGLALVAVLLMLIGIRRLSAYFLIPHLLMQFATIVSWTLMACYLVLLIVGGTSIKTSSVVYENSERDRIGLVDIDSQESLRLQAHVPELNYLFVVLLGLNVFMISIQIWFFSTIRRCFVLLRDLSQTKARTEMCI